MPFAAVYPLRALCYPDRMNLQSALSARLVNRSFAYAYFFYRQSTEGRA